MARACIFCGGTEMSKQHIWPAWAARMLNEDGPWRHFMQTEHDGEKLDPRSWLRDPFEETTNAVCRTCNNGWMSALEDRAKPHLEAMLRLETRELDPEGQGTLAAWALQTALILVHTQGAKHGVASKQEHAFLREHGEPSTNIKVWIAAYTGEHPATAQISGVDRRKRPAGPLPNPARGSRHIWSVTHSFGPVLFVIFGTDLPGFADRVNIPLPDVQIIRRDAEVVTWSPSPCCDSAQLLAFGDAFAEMLTRLGAAF